MHSALIECEMLESAWYRMRRDGIDCACASVQGITDDHRVHCHHGLAARVITSRTAVNSLAFGKSIHSRTCFIMDSDVSSLNTDLICCFFSFGLSAIILIICIARSHIKIQFSCLHLCSTGEPGLPQSHRCKRAHLWGRRISTHTCCPEC